MNAGLPPSWHDKAAQASRLVLTPLAALTSAIPPVGLDSGLHASHEASRAINLVDDPVKAMAAGTSVSGLQRVAGFLGKALPTATVAINTLNGARIIDQAGPRALVNTKQGRGAVLGAIGGGLMLVPTPPTQVGAAGVLAVAAANELGALKRLDTWRSAPQRRTLASPAPAR